MSDEASPNTSKKTKSSRGQRALALLIDGAGFDEIAAKTKIPRKQIEKILRDELGRRWVAPTQTFANLQIARLETIILTLIGRVKDGELGAIDRALKIMDRLDRYHGFTRANRAIVEPYGDEERERLMNKINAIAARLESENPDE